MKTWQWIGTIVVAVLLGVCLAVSATYFVLDRSLLDEEKTKQALKSTKIYEAIRGDKLIPQLTEDISKETTYNGAFTKTDVIDSLRAALPQDTVTTMTNTVVDATYQWLNKKSPDISFSVSVTSEKQAFLDAIDQKVTTNLEKMPVCRTLAQIEQAADTLQCIPPNSSDVVIHDAIMTQVTDKMSSVDDTVTAETLGLSTAQLGGSRNLPDYLSYLWTLNLITLPLAAFLALYLVIKRHGYGMVVVGTVALALSVACIAVGQYLAGIPLPTDTTIRLFFVQESTLVGAQLRVLALWGGAVGTALIIGGIVWIRRGKRHSRGPVASHTKQSGR